MEDERKCWDLRYSEGSHASVEPDPFLEFAFKEFIQPLFPAAGTAVDIAGGIGRHAIWLARRDWRVKLADISAVAIEKARYNAGAFRSRIQFEVANLAKFKASLTRRYDMVLVFFYLERKIFPELLKALRPGGLLIYKTYTERQRESGGGPSHPMHLLRQGELLRTFPGMDVLFYDETIRGRGVAEFVGRRCRAKS